MIIDKIHSVNDLRELPQEELPELAYEIREEIIDVVSRTGGHLAPSLGVVDLTIALHYAFDTPNDRIVWDVGHQAYAHKILTGRRAQFSTLRQHGGISGFPKREESLFDHFDVGHASTSISAALGMIAARDIKGEDFKVIAVIGDGSISAGLAFEGLNQAGHLKKNLVVILNDNEMSISPNVGALSSYLSRLMTGNFYTRLRKETKQFLQGIPRVGESMFNLAKKAEDSIKGLMVPGMLFEDLGFQYIGPIDGHNIHHLLGTFQNIKNYTWPVLVHVITKKGKGCEFAECDPSQYHGTPPFDRETGKVGRKSQVLSYTEVFGQTMIRLATDNSRIIAISAAMSDGTGLDKFAAQFPDRFFDVGIAESHGVTFACGLAVEGLHPVAAIYSTFTQRAYDQIVHDLCLQNLPVTLALDRAGLVGEDGPTHHGAFDIAYLRHVPNMVVMAPKDENELQHMIKTAVEHPGPTAVRYPRGTGYGVPMDQELKKLDIGKAELLMDGNDVAIIAIGSMVYPSLAAAKRLAAADGITAAVVNARFVKPLDAELILALAKKTCRIVTAEEHALLGGFGSAVLECLDASLMTGVKTLRIGLPDEYIEHGTQGVLRQKYGLDTDGIYATIRDFVMRSRLKALTPFAVLKMMDAKGR